MHISLDFWNTIGIPNPNYAIARNKILSDWYSKGINKLDIDEAGRIYADVKATIDKTHNAFCRPLSMRMVYEILDDVMSILDYHSVDHCCLLRLALSEEFHKHPPKILDETWNELTRIFEEGKHTLSIGSNTNFIRGQDIAVHLPYVWKFQVFSDRLGWAKPHAEFWKEVERLAAPADRIWHIGDHPVCDRNTSIGIESHVIKDAYELPSFLRELTA